MYGGDRASNRAKKPSTPKVQQTRRGLGPGVLARSLKKSDKTRLVPVGTATTTGKPLERASTGGQEPAEGVPFQAVLFTAGSNTNVDQKIISEGAKQQVQAAKLNAIPS